MELPVDDFDQQVYSITVKAISVHEAATQLERLVAEAYKGETIVLTDGERQVTLEPRVLNLEEDSPELEAELLKAVEGPHAPYSEEEMREIADRARSDYRARQK